MSDPKPGDIESAVFSELNMLRLSLEREGHAGWNRILYDFGPTTNERLPELVKLLKALLTVRGLSEQLILIANNLMARSERAALR